MVGIQAWDHSLLALYKQVRIPRAPKRMHPVPSNPIRVSRNGYGTHPATLGCYSTWGLPEQDCQQIRFLKPFWQPYWETPDLISLGRSRSTWQGGEHLIHC